MSIYYEVVRNLNGKIVRLDKLDSDGFEIRKVAAINGNPAPPNTYIQMSNGFWTSSMFECLEKTEPGDPKFLLNLLASIAQWQSERL